MLIRSPGFIKPRHPHALSLGQGNDEQRVEKAKQELLALLTDPFGFEAFQRIREKHPELFVKTARSLGSRQGQYARRLQSGDKPESDKKGRPSLGKRPLMRTLAAYVESRQVSGRAKKSRVQILRELGVNEPERVAQNISEYLQLTKKSKIELIMLNKMRKALKK